MQKYKLHIWPPPSWDSVRSEDKSLVENRFERPLHATTNGNIVCSCLPDFIYIDFMNSLRESSVEQIGKVWLKRFEILNCRVGYFIYLQCIYLSQDRDWVVGKSWQISILKFSKEIPKPVRKLGHEIKWYCSN